LLKHKDSPETQPQSAAQVRVTPEELASAIARLEARKDASQRNLAGTIHIGEAVEQLGIEATSEEVFAEVRAGRAITPKRRAALWDRVWLTASVGMAFFGVAVSSWHFYGTGNPIGQVAMNDVQSTQTQESLPLSIQATGLPIHADPNLLVADASHKIVMLSEVSDNRPVSSLLEDEGLTSYHGGSVPGYFWTLIKHDGRVYLRGWTARISKQAMQKEGVDVSAVRDASFTVPITLPVSDFVLLPSDNGDIMLHTHEAILDSHTYEKWQP
jgi:hypothetical protein